MNINRFRFFFMGKERGKLPFDAAGGKPGSEMLLYAGKEDNNRDGCQERCRKQILPFDHVE